MNLFFCTLCSTWLRPEDVDGFQIIQESGHKRLLLNRATGVSHLIAKGMALKKALRQFPIPNELKPETRVVVPEPVQQIEQAPVTQEVPVKLKTKPRETPSVIHVPVTEADISKETFAIVESESDLTFEGTVTRWEKLYGKGIAKLSRRHLLGHHTVSLFEENIVTYGSLAKGKKIRCRVALDPNPSEKTPIAVEIEIYQ